MVSRAQIRRVYSGEIIYFQQKQRRLDTPAIISLSEYSKRQNSLVRIVGRLF